MTSMVVDIAAKAQELSSRFERPQAALIPLLFEIQEVRGAITLEDELEVARCLGIDLRVVHEAVEFYPLIFTRAMGKYHIQICHNISCHLLGAESLIEVLQEELKVPEKTVTPDGLFSWQRAECLGACGDAPAMLVGKKLFGYLTQDKVRDLIRRLRNGEEVENDTPLTYTDPLPDGAVSVNFLIKDAHHLRVAEDRGAYRALRRALLEMSPDDILKEVKDSGLRGQGGAGFPAGMKWAFVPRDVPWTRYLCVNADESEPGTCKDREILRRDPHRLIEGTIIAARAIGVHKAYIYVRREFYEPREILENALKEAYDAGYLGKSILGSDFDLDIFIHTGGGAYICGEETGLIESLEGKKGWPRIKPPYPALKGLFGRPTVVNNVETLSHIPYIILNGAARFRSRGTEQSPGTKLFCISGHVVRPGVWELPMGYSLKRMIYDLAGGIWRGRKLKAIIPGGSSVQVLTAQEIDLQMDFESVREAGSALGSGGIIVMDETVSMPQVLEVIARFYRHESCGQCTPCREGTIWAYKILYRLNRGRGRKGDLETLWDVANNMDGATICPFGSAAAWPIQAMLKKFPEEFERLIL